VKKRVEVEKSKGGIFRVICIILGILYILIALALFFWGAYFRGGLLLVTAIFAFLPRKITKVPEWAKCLIILGVFLIIYIIGQVSLYQINNNFIYHNMQESFNIDDGELSIIVYNTTEFESIRDGNQTITTEGYFLSVNCGITNLEKDSTTLSPTYKLMDNQNTTYKDWGFSGYNQYFQPHLEREIYFLFEVSKTAQGLKLYIDDETGVHVVDLEI